MEILNLTQVDSSLRLKSVLKKFETLQNKHSFILHFNHNLKHYYEEIATKKGEILNWKNLAQGPIIWEAKITKLLPESAEITIGEIVAEDIRFTEVFSKYDIDFCCGGNETLDNVCKEKGLNKKEIELELKNIDNSNSNGQLNFDNWDLDYLADYIVDKHHNYIKNNVNIIYDLCQKVTKVHSTNHKELIKITELFKSVAIEVKPHMFKEENILFPYIKKLVNAKQNKQPFKNIGTIKNPLRRMMIEHDSVGELMEQIKQLCNSYIPPKEACSSYKLLLTKFFEFEHDLHQHVHLENNILFPKTILLEEELTH